MPKLKDQLISMGVAEETAQKIVDEIIEGKYIPKSRFDEINEDLKQQKAAVSDRDKQLEDLKKSAGDNVKLQKQIEELQNSNAEAKKAHDAEIKQLKLDNAVNNALTAAGAKNAKAVKALIDMGKVKLDGEKLMGWDDQIAEIQKSDAYLFNVQSAPSEQAKLKGFQPGASGGDVKPGTDVDTSKMTYSQMVAFKAANPDAKLDF